MKNLLLILPPLTYRDAGVDIDAGDALVTTKSNLMRAARCVPACSRGSAASARCLSCRKAFANQCWYQGPTVWGTKLKLAFELNRHDTIGIDWWP